MHLAVVASSCDHIAKLPDDILGRILYSGYLSSAWYSTVAVVLVCKKFQHLGHTYIAHVSNAHRYEIDRHTLRPLPLSPSGIPSVAQCVVYLDLSFTELEYTPDLGNMLVSMRATLSGLSLRGTGARDDFIGEYVSQLTRLKYLNVSQTKGPDKGLITDQGACQLRSLTKLKWLNISMTNISSATAVELQSAIPCMTHLDVYGCPQLNDDMVPALVKWPLRSLDISNCPLLSLGAIERLSTTGSASLHTTLENLACCYLPEVPTVQALPLLLQLPKLRRLDFRKTLSDVVPAELLKRARAQLEVVILQHEDQLRGLKGLSVIDAAPRLQSVCPVLAWPYRAAEL